MANTDKYIPLAFKAIENVRLTKPKDGQEQPSTFIENNEFIPAVYKGYISSLGASIIQAGIKTAILFYEANESGSEGDKRLITAAIRYMLNPPENNNTPFSAYKISEILSSDPHELQNQALQIMDAATALKIVLRTYKMK